MTNLHPLYFHEGVTFADLLKIMDYGIPGVPSIEAIKIVLEGKRGQLYDKCWNEINNFLSYYPNIFKSPLPYSEVLMELLFVSLIRRNSRQ